MGTLSLVPMTITAASLYIRDHHRHHTPPRGGLFAVGVESCGVVVGVAIIGRPVARMLADGYTAEVTRVATDGSQNACSMLYGASWRAARALGYKRLITYTLESEPGTSLRAAGWIPTVRVRGRKWDTPSRRRDHVNPTDNKQRWERSLVIVNQDVDKDVDNPLASGTPERDTGGDERGAQ